MDAFIARLKEGADRASRFLWNQMPLGQRQFLTSPQGSASGKEAEVVHFLNSVVRGAVLTAENGFEARRSVTRALLTAETNFLSEPAFAEIEHPYILQESGLSPAQVLDVCRNRHLLEDTFPEDLENMTQARAASPAGPGRHSLLIIDNSLRQVLWERSFDGGGINEVMVVDLANDGSRDILVHADNRLRLLKTGLAVAGRRDSP
jgi:hypothetical protein